MEVKTDTRLQFAKTHTTDVCIVVDDIEFYLHKNILSKKSPFFEAMFARNWRENAQTQEGQPIYLSELDPDVCRTVFHFIYTSKVVLPGIHDSISWFSKYSDLIEVANYFAISEDMELGMGNALKKLLTRHTVFKVWQLSQFAGSEVLSKQCEKYLITNFQLASEESDFFFCSRELLKRILIGGEIDCDPDLILERLRLWARFNMYQSLEHSVLGYSEIAEKKFLMDLLPPQTLFSKTLKRAILTADKRN